MSIRSRVRAGEIFLALLAIGVIVALGVYAAPSHLPGPQSSSAGSKSGSPNGLLLGTLNPGIPPIFGANVRANSDPTQNGQHEPSLAVSRVHTNTVVVASKDYRYANQKEVWIDVSTDGGVTWPMNRQLQMPGVDPSMYPLESDPVVMARDDGRIYVSCLAYNNQNAVFITWTDDDGATWHPSVRLAPPDSGLDDKDWFAIDNTPTSPYYHRMYMMYAPQGAAYVAEQHSTDGGATWSPRHQIGANGTEYTYPVVGSDGTVYDFMMDNWGAGQTGTILLTKSTDGGASWSPTATVTTAEQPNTPIRGSDQFRFFAILSAAVDPNNGNLFVAWTDNRNFATNGTDVVYVRSTDHGATWSGVTRLSHDPTGVVRDHITPVITIGRDSRLHAFWLDRRSDPNNHFWDSWYNSSTDGGVTWEAPTDVPVSTQHQDLNVGLPPGSGGAAGDYWGIDTVQDTVYVGWNDTRNGIDQDIDVARGLFAGGGSPTPTALVSSTPTVAGTNTPTSVVTSSPAATGITPSVTRTVTNMPTGTNTIQANPSGTATATSTVTQAITGTPIVTPSTTPVAGCDAVWASVTGPTNLRLNAASATSRSDAWAVGNGGIYHWHGQNWVSVSFPLPSQAQSVALNAVSSWSAIDAWAAGSYVDAAGNQQAVVYHWDGSVWSVVPQTAGGSPTGGTLNYLYGVSATRPGVAFAVGQSVSGGSVILYRCDVTSCAPSPHPGTGLGLNAVWASGTADAWAVGDVVMHYDGASWTVISTPSAGILRGVWGSATSDVWAVGDSSTIHWDGTSWSQVPGPAAMKAIWGSAPNDVWAVGDTIQHWDGSSWAHVSGPAASLYGVRGSAPDDIWAVGQGGAILHYGPLQHFTDVPQGSTFYTYVQTLACRGIVSGYPCGGPGEPCDTGQRPYFRTGNNVTRGQLSKIVAGAAGFNEPVSSQTFEDIAPGSTFYPFIERLATRGIISGYPCGGPGEPCGQGNKPYFRPNNNSTRGQIAKIASNAAGFIDPQTVQFFQDVPVGSTFQPYIGRLYSRGLITGYPCGGPGEPCVPPDNLPYFHPNNNSTRGQTSKIVSNTFFP